MLGTPYSDLSIYKGGLKERGRQTILPSPVVTGQGVGIPGGVQGQVSAERMGLQAT